MSALILVTPGDDLAISLTLYESGIPAVLTGATIYAAIQDGLGRQIVSSAVQSSTATGASWPVGIVVCEFASANTTKLSPKDAWLEIEVIRGGKKKTWPLFPVEVQKGSI